MIKENSKVKIEELQSQISSLNSDLFERLKQISEILGREQILINENKKLLVENERLIKENDKLRSKNIDFKEQVHNERGAGRKSKFSSQEIETIKMYRLQGNTIRELAEMFECSAALIHKIINGK